MIGSKRKSWSGQCHVEANAARRYGREAFCVNTDIIVRRLIICGCHRFQAYESCHLSRIPALNGIHQVVIQDRAGGDNEESAPESNLYYRERLPCDRVDFAKHPESRAKLLSSEECSPVFGSLHVRLIFYVVYVMIISLQSL